MGEGVTVAEPGDGEDASPPGGAEMSLYQLLLRSNGVGNDGPPVRKRKRSKDVIKYVQKVFNHTCQIKILERIIEEGLSLS